MSGDPRRVLGEACGVVGVFTPGQEAAPRVHRALHALQHRGQEAAGIASLAKDGDIRHLRGRGLVAEALPTYRVESLPGELAIGHVRYSTVPADRAENIQPIVATTPYGRFAIAHNGNLKNAEELRRDLEARGSLLSTTMDTELLVHLMARSGESDFAAGLRVAAQQVQGAYSLAMICDGALYALRDPNAVRPLVVGELTSSAGWVVASESVALEVVGARFVREVAAGELLRIDATGLHSTQLLGAARPAPCVFELVYFARPDSTIFGQGAHGARVRMGEELAAEDLEASGADVADLVVPVPDSGVPAAAGYARHSGVPLELAIIRSHYVGRTFILPDQDARTASIHLKLSVVREAVAGKRVAVVDDSIVRGNTSRQIVAMLRDAGAKEVWMRIASPPLAWPCFLGIDTPDREELVINRLGSVEAVRRHIGADSLRFLSQDGLRRATLGRPFCFGCMDGDYPV